MPAELYGFLNSMIKTTTPPTNELITFIVAGQSKLMVETL